MPTAPPRLCPRHRIPVHGVCPVCQRARYRQVDSQRGTSTERGYTAEWRVLRVRAFERDGWTCVDCGWQPDIVALYKRLGIDEAPQTAAVLDELRARKVAGLRHLHGDHVLSIERRPDLRLDLGNIATRCDICHARKGVGTDGVLGSKGTR